MSNKVTQEDLFQGLKDAIEELQLKESIEKEPIEKEFEEYCRPFEAEFDAKTKEQQDAAMEVLKPAKQRLDDKVQELTRKAQRQIDTHVKKYMTYQKEIEKQFYKNPIVKQALQEKEDAIKAQKDAVHQRLNAISDRTDADIKALQEKYNAEAQALESALQESKAQA